MKTRTGWNNLSRSPKTGYFTAAIYVFIIGRKSSQARKGYDFSFREMWQIPTVFLRNTKGVDGRFMKTQAGRWMKNGIHGVFSNFIGLSSVRSRT
ncbi:MAG: hypothetical protein AB7T38_07430 [Nitrospirales bacterium]